MHHTDKPHIIAAEDIAAVHSITLMKHPDGRQLAHMVVELRPDKEYTQEDLRLHVTNGVSHHIHIPTGEVLPVEEEVKEDTN